MNGCGGAALSRRNMANQLGDNKEIPTGSAQSWQHSQMKVNSHATNIRFSQLLPRPLYVQVLKMIVGQTQKEFLAVWPQTLPGNSTFKGWALE